MSIDPVVFGQRLRHYRRRRGLTLEELGATIGRPAPFLSLVENGKREPKLSQISALAESLGVSVADLLDEEPPNRRARLEIALERAQQHPRYSELGLPYLKPSARLPDDAIDHIVTLFDQIVTREVEAATDSNELRLANAEIGRMIHDANGYLPAIERVAVAALERCGYSGPGALTSRHLTDLVASLGFRIRFVDDMPSTVRSVVDQATRRIYVAQRNELRTRQARKAILQTVGGMLLGHREPSSAREYLQQRLETAYFAAAVLVPEISAVPFLQAAQRERDLSVEDIKEQFYVSYEMAAQRFTNLATQHLGLATHFLRNDSDGTIWKSYANDGILLPVDDQGGSEGQRLCRMWGARTAFSSADKFAIHHQFTDTPTGSYWCATHIATDLSGHAFTIGVRFEDARQFRGRRTNLHRKSSCPNGSCCATTGSALPPVFTRTQHRLVSLLAPGLAGPEKATVEDFIERHAEDETLSSDDDTE
jgi:predicted transcriptional regulator/transcriptional regulator with XRE-family HTH domain